MDYKTIRNYYNKIIYLEMIDNTIHEYKKNILISKYGEMLKGIITHRDYYDNYNSYVITLIKKYNYYNNYNK